MPPHSWTSRLKQDRTLECLAHKGVHLDSRSRHGHESMHALAFMQHLQATLS